jgi:hypothetical protein
VRDLRLCGWVGGKDMFTAPLWMEMVGKDHCVFADGDCRERYVSLRLCEWEL